MRSWNISGTRRKSHFRDAQCDTEKGHQHHDARMLTDTTAFRDTDTAGRIR